MSAVLELRDVTFAYPAGPPVLRGVSLRIAAGERVALLGRNGAGKSTLLLQLNGLLRGDGVLEVDGVRLQDATLGRIRASVGLVFQDPDDQLFCPTVFDDVAFGPLYMGLPAEEVRRRATTALENVGLAGFHDRPPHQLSGGEKKRAAIATVLSMSPSLLVFDEPTAGLDAGARRALIDLLETLPQAMLIATHDLELAAELLPRALVVDDGRIVEDAPTQGLLAAPERLTRWGLRDRGARRGGTVREPAE